MSDVKLKAVIEAEDRTAGAIQSAQKNVEGLQKKVDNLQPAFKGMAVAGGVAFTAISALAITSFKAYAEAEAETVVATKSLQNTIAQMTDAQRLQYAETGNVADVLKEVSEAMNMAGKSAIKLGFDDEEAGTAFSKLFAVTKDSVQAMKEVTLAEDLARYKGISLTEATSKLMLVHSGATKELKALGLAVVDGATSMENLDAITKQVTGTSAEFAKTAEGAMQIMQVTTDNLSEAIGGALAPAFDKVKTAILPVVQSFVEWAEKNPDIVAKIIITTGAVSGLVLVVGTLGMLLPGVIALFGFLASPIGLCVVAITALVAGAIYFHDRLGELMTLIDTKTGLITLMRDAWEQIVLTFNQFLLPALAQLWKALEPLKPFLEFLVKIIGATLVVAIGAIVLAVKGWIQIFTILTSVVTEASALLVNVFGKALTWVSDKLKSAYEWAVRLVEKIQQLNILQGAKNMAKGAMGAVGGFFTNVGNAVTGALGINDGIVQNGQVITTHPDDYIIATKTPGNLGGKSINININGAVFSRESALMLGDIIVGELKTQMRY